MTLVMTDMEYPQKNIKKYSINSIKLRIRGKMTVMELA
ncbi:putative two-component regulatory system, sensor kinase domain protein [Bacteroides fragilis str. DS-71]|nr:putative two-component regulatory system, sensor kinase domain protein [Bacteroides fragilis str. DS-71]